MDFLEIYDDKFLTLKIYVRGDGYYFKEVEIIFNGKLKFFLE